MHFERIDIESVIRSAIETSRPVIDAGGHTLSVGIAPDMLPRVFEMFVQVSRSASRAQGGLGVGLTLVKSLVERHGGLVEAHSEGLGHGSRFVVKLPVTVPVSGADARSGELPQTALLQHRRVLVIDDNRDSADSLAMLLRLMGAEVRVVYDGREALEGLAAYAPAVMFVDIGMPKIDGYAVARRVRRHSSCSGILLIALTGWGQEEDRRRSRDAGFDYHLVKPASMDALDRVLRAGLGGAPRSSER